MQSPKRGNKKYPSRPSYSRSPSLPTPVTQDHYVATNAACRADSLDINSNGKDCQHELRSHTKPNTRPFEHGFVGFGAPHPKLQSSTKQRSALMSLEQTKYNTQTDNAAEKSFKDDELLKSVERLIQNILQSQSVTINHDTIQMAIQQNASLQSKKRYASMLEKPWRIAASPLSSDINECSESSTLDKRNKLLALKNPKSYRRSVSYDGPRIMSNQVNTPTHPGTDQGQQQKQRHRSPTRRAGIKPIAIPSTAELEESQQALHEANQHIISLQRTIEGYEAKLKEKTEKVADDTIDESLSSTNINGDDDKIAGFAEAKTELNVDKISTNRPPEYIRAISPDHRSNNFSSSANAVSRLEYRALQIRNEQLLHTIKLYEEQLDEIETLPNNALDDVTGKLSSNLGISTMSNEQEKDIMVNIVSRLNVVDNETSRQLKYMESKISALVQQLQNSESKCKILSSSDATSKATIEDLSKKLTDCELKAKEFNENLMIQTERRIDHVNKAVQRMEQESKAATDEAARANLARLAYETKYFQLEQTHEEVVQKFRDELGKSEAKSKCLEDEVNKLMITSVEIVQLTTDKQLLQRQLQQSECVVSELRSNERSRIQAVVDDVQRKAYSRIHALEKSLVSANTATEAATRRLTELESAQAREQKILSEELRDSETTIACLMEEIEALKPLVSEKTAMDQLMKEQKEEFELKELEIAESKAALAQSECDVEELRNELQMLTSLPDIVRKMQRELKDAQTKLAGQKVSHSEAKKSLDLSAHSNKGRNAMKQLELQLQETKSLLSAKEVELLTFVELQKKFNDLQEANSVAGDEIIKLKSQLDLMEPLASDLENAERELKVTCEKLDTAERDLETLTNQLDLLKPLAADLDEAEMELADARLQLAEKISELEQAQARIVEQHCISVSSKNDRDSVPMLQSQLDCARKQIEDLTSELEHSERKVSEFDSELQRERANMSALLRLSEEKVIDLLAQLQSHESDTHIMNQLRNDIERKNDAIVSLERVVSEKVEEALQYRSWKSEMEANLKKKEQLVEELRCEIQNTASQSTQITLEYASLIPERDSLRKKLAETSSKIDTLEKEIEQKNALILDLTAQRDDKSVLESLQQEHERTLERCSDLSLQLAESQFTIGQLTERIRGHERTAIRHPSPSLSTRTTSTGIDSSRTPKSFQSLLNNGIDRISSRLDDSLRGSTNLTSVTLQDNHTSNSNGSRAFSVQPNRSFQGA